MNVERMRPIYVRGNKIKYPETSSDAPPAALPSLSAYVGMLRRISNPRVAVRLDASSLSYGHSNLAHCTRDGQGCGAYGASGGKDGTGDQTRQYFYNSSGSTGATRWVPGIAGSTEEEIKHYIPIL